MKTVVITGLSSFLGYHLANGFADAGYRVVGTVSRDPREYTGIQLSRLSRLNQNVTIRRLDLTDSSELVALVEQQTPDIWIYHAGHARNYGSFDYDTGLGWATNVAPIPPLCNALARQGAGLIVTGSSAEYRFSASPNREDDICIPATPYGISKLAETQASAHCSKVLDLPTRVARIFIPFGPLDNPTKLLPQVITNLGAKKRVDLSLCTQQRDFIGISDVVAGYLALADDLGRGGFDVFNLSSGQGIPLRTLVLKLATLMGADFRLLNFGAKPMRLGEPDFSAGDNTKAGTLLHWHPKALDDALACDLANSAQNKPNSVTT